MPNLTEMDTLLFISNRQSRHFNSPGNSKKVSRIFRDLKTQKKGSFPAPKNAQTVSLRPLKTPKRLPMFSGP